MNVIKKQTIIMVSALLFFTFFFSINTASAQIPANVRVGIVSPNTGSQYRNASAITISIKGNYDLVDLSAIPGENLVSTANEGESWQIYYLPSGIQAYKNGQPVKITVGPLVFREKQHSQANRISLDSYNINSKSINIGKWYRGNMEFRNSGSCLSAINELPMDEYLYGVVPREMSNSWPIEALKAQAIAARTYTVANYNKHVIDGFNMLDTPYDQAYGGFNCEGNATVAVQQTSGQIILYNGKPVSAVYHSTSGGHTEDSENVWGSTPSGYLRGKVDPYSTKNGLANWSYSTTVDAVKNKLVSSGASLGPIKSIQLDKYNSGRVKTVIITDINGNTIKKSGNDFGKLFNPKFYTYIGNTYFMSNFFNIKMDSPTTPKFSVLNGAGQISTVEAPGFFGISDDLSIQKLNGNSSVFYVADASDMSSFDKASTGKIVFEGHGWGHGVGMSQWGAYQMAKEGKGYSDILHFYYTGVEISANY